MLHINPVRFAHRFTVVSDGLQSRPALINGRDRVLKFIVKFGAAVLLAVGMLIGMLVLWAGIIFASIWSLLFMLSYF
jgi:hypothetical protein